MLKTFKIHLWGIALRHIHCHRDTKKNCLTTYSANGIHRHHRVGSLLSWHSTAVSQCNDNNDFRFQMHRWMCLNRRDVPFFIQILRHQIRFIARKRTFALHSKLRKICYLLDGCTKRPNILSTAFPLHAAFSADVSKTLFSHYNIAFFDKVVNIKSWA